MADRLHIAGLPLFTADTAVPAPGFEPGAAFWRALEKLAPDDRLSGQVDALLAGAAAPRVWLLLHEPGQPQLSAVAALMLARALVSRGQNVLVLDTDEAGAALTIWSEREETEGWIDVARFGASVLSAGADLPFRGGRGLLLGVGSFVPTDVSEDEVIALLARLRHQADDILLVAAVGPAALPWARRAERRLFCWDRSLRTSAQLGPVCGPFAAEGVPLTGLIGYGEAAAVRTAPAAAAVPAAANAAPSPVVAPAPPAAAARTESPTPEPAAQAGKQAQADKQAEADKQAQAGKQAQADKQTQANKQAPPDQLVAPVAAGATDGLGPELEAPRGTPRAFWLAAAAFGVVLVVITWYWTNYVRVPPGGYFEPVVTSPASPDSSAGAGLVQAPPARAAADSAAGTAGQEAPRRVAGASGQVTVGDTLPDPAETATVAPAPAPAAAGAAFDRAPYTTPAGQAGWALHVYSLPDSAGAEAQVDALERAGFRAAVRIVEIPEKGGRWWRVYVGSFPTRSAAAAAMPALLQRLQADWAEPARIQESTP